MNTTRKFIVITRVVSVKTTGKYIVVVRVVSAKSTRKCFVTTRVMSVICTRKLTVMKAMSVNQTVNVFAVMTLAPVPF